MTARANFGASRSWPAKKSVARSRVGRGIGRAATQGGAKGGEDTPGTAPVSLTRLRWRESSSGGVCNFFGARFAPPRRQGGPPTPSPLARGSVASRRTGAVQATAPAGVRSRLPTGQGGALALASRPRPGVAAAGRRAGSSPGPPKSRGTPPQATAYGGDTVSPAAIVPSAR